MQDHDLIAWIIIGLVAGWLAGRVVEGHGFGFLGDLVLGVAGAILGGVLLRHLAPDLQYGFLGSIVVAFIGASLLIAVLRALSGGRPLGGHRLRAGPRWGRRF
jgi:uncharacterized membrane protein YeaQ/YmgE (transglycosylase-associated protein family)